jgi:hypothetical protein
MMATLSRLKLDFPGGQPSVISIYHRANYLRVKGYYILHSSASTSESAPFLVDRMGIEPIDSDLARITRNPITQPL